MKFLIRYSSRISWLNLNIKATRPPALRALDFLISTMNDSSPEIKPATH